MRLKYPKIQEGLLILFLGIALGVYSIYKFQTAAVQTQWIMSPYLFPLLLSVFTVLISLSLLLEGIHEGDRYTPAASLNLKRLGMLLLLCILYAALLPHLSFVPATMLFLAATIRYLGEKRLWLIALIATVMPLVLYLIFAVGLSVRLP